MSASILWAGNKRKQLNEAADAGSSVPDLIPDVWAASLTLLWYPERFWVSRHDLMHDSTELIQHLQALLLAHAGVVEAWESWLERRQEVRSQQHQAGQLGRWAFLTFVASVRMSLESFTRHCSGTVTSMTFALSCFRLLSVTNFPYQALRMMRPGFTKQQQTYYCAILMCSKIPNHFLIGPKQFHYAEFIHRYIKKKGLHY